jgi:protein phosphatase 1 regulatory subunit 11
MLLPLFCLPFLFFFPSKIYTHVHKWHRDENVVDNEGLGRKSSKRCCIFHRERSFGESSTDSDYDSDRSGSSSGTNSASGDKKATGKHKKKIARPKNGKKVPDSQRYHA